MAVPSPKPGGIDQPARSEKATKPDRPGDNPASNKSGPVSMQPSGPVPKAEAVASGSGPKQTRAIPSSSDEINPAWSVLLHEIERVSITTHGSAVAPVFKFSQLSALPTMRASVVLPQPRGPQNKNAWCTRPAANAFPSVRVTCS